MAFVGDERVDCTALDISAAGLAMLSPIARRPGQFIRVNFCLLGGTTPRWYDADGVVVRASQARTGVVLGVQFVVIEDRVAREVHSYVADTLRSIASRAVDLRRVAGSSVVASSVPSSSSSTTEGRIPDANHPPKSTGEFGPPEPRRGGTAPAVPRASTSETAAPPRRTGEYGSSPSSTAAPPASASTPAPARTRPATIPPSTVDTAVGRRPTPVPKPAAAPATDASRERVAEEVSKSEIASLIKQALDEVDRGPPTGPGKGRGKPRR